MEPVIPTVFAALALLIVYGVWRRIRRPTPGTAATPQVAVPSGRRERVVLDVPAAAPSESLRRLVREAAARAFALRSDVAEVEVVDRSGTVLGVIARQAHVHPAEPPTLVSPHPTAGPPLHVEGLEDELHLTVVPGFNARERPAPERPLADHFELPDVVRARMRDPRDPVDVLRSILEAGGSPAEVDGNVVRSRGTVFVVVRSVYGRAVLPALLSEAYLRVRETGADGGYVLSFGFMDPEDVRRRESFAPSIRHVGVEAVQRMADAVAVGADPLAFVLRPAVAQAGTEVAHAEATAEEAG